MKKLLAKIRKILKDRRTRQLLTRIVSITAAIVVFVTTYALVLPAITMESEADCGIPAHQHDDSCYEDRLICGEVEGPGHHHSDACYSISKSLVCKETEHQHDDSCFDEDGNLTCELAEHTHDDSCYEEVRELVCDIPESEGHEHTADCYERVLACGMEAHTHSTACYSHTSDLAASAPVDFAAVATTELGSFGATISASAETESNPEETSNTWASVESAAGGLSSVVADTTDSAASDYSSTATAAGTASTGFDAATAEDAFVPQLEPIFFEQLLTKDTGIYYYHAEEGEEVPENSADIADWKRVNDDTELAPTDLLRVYLRYTIPAGALNATNDIARYRLPSNLHLTDQQMEAINTTVNGIANQYVNLDTLEITDTERYNTYLGIEATEGTRKPSDNIDEYFTNHPDLEGQEYINAVVRAENVFDETTEEYLGQDLVFTFTPYTVQKNQHEYDAEGQPTKAGQKVYGWLCFDLHMDQIDWSEPVISTIEDPAAPAPDVSIENTEDTESSDTTEATEKAASDTDEDAALSSSNPDELNTNTITEKKDSSAEIVFAAKDKTLKIDEISTELHLVELNTLETENDAAQDESDQSADDSTDNANSEMTDAEGDTADDSNPEGETDKSGSADDSATDTENQPESEMEINAETYPAVSFEDTITVQAGTLSTDNENAAKETPAETAITVSVIAEEETFPLGTTMQLGTVEDMDTVASAVEGAVEGQTRGFHAVDISFHNPDGKEIEPLKPIKVSMTSDAIKQAVEDSSTAPVVVHVENPEDSVTANSATYPDDDTSAGKSNTPSQAETITSAPVATIVETTETPNTENTEDMKETADTLSFDAGSFSVYAIVYTVDFHYEINGKIYEFSIPGGGFVSLEHVVEVLGIATADENAENGAENAENDAENGNDFVGEVPGVDVSGENGTAYEEAIQLNEVEVSEATKKFVADVESVEFSSPELVWVGKVDEAATVGGLKEANGLEVEYSAELTEEQIAEINAQTVEAGDWALIGVQPFTSEESLTVTMKNGDQFVVKVTDAAHTIADGLTSNNNYVIYTTVDGYGNIAMKNDGFGTRDLSESALGSLDNSFLWTLTYNRLTNTYRISSTEEADIGGLGFLFYTTYLNLVQDDDYQPYSLFDQNSLYIEQIGSDASDGFYLYGLDSEGGKHYLSWNPNPEDEYHTDFYVSSDNRAVIYFYEPLHNYTVKVENEDTTKGTVSGTDSTGSPQNNVASYDGAMLNNNNSNAGTITATAADGYRFLEWKLDGEVLTSLGHIIQEGQLTINKPNMVLEAVFEPEFYEFTVQTGDGNKGTVSGTNNEDHAVAEVVSYTARTNETSETGSAKNRDQISATGKAGYYFDKWELRDSDGTLVREITGDTINVEDFVISSSGMTLTALFTGDGYVGSDPGKQYSNDSMEKWYESLESYDPPLSSYTKSAEVWDYDNRIYQINFSAASGVQDFTQNIELAFILDVSNSMLFPSSMTELGEASLNNLDSVINNLSADQREDNGVYFVIGDENYTATVYAIKKVDGVWKGMDASYYAQNAASVRSYSWNNLSDLTSFNSWNQTKQIWENWSGNKLAYDSNTTYTIYKANDHYFEGMANRNTLYSLNGAVGYNRFYDLKLGMEKVLAAVESIRNENASKFGNGNVPQVKVGLVTFASDVQQNTNGLQNLSGNTVISTLASGTTTGGTRQDRALDAVRNWTGNNGWTSNNGNTTTKRIGILITDGAPNNSAKWNTDYGASDVRTAATKFKNNNTPNNTNDDRMLVTVGLSMDNVLQGPPLMRSISSGDDYYYRTKDSGDLKYVLYDILNTFMSEGIVQGDVIDTIDPAFYPVDSNGNALVSGQSYTDEYGHTYTVTKDGDTWTVNWDNQNFPWEHDGGWHGSVLVKAKEDFLGGNAVATNKEAKVISEQYTLRDNTSTPAATRTVTITDTNIRNKTLDVPHVNVNELSLGQNDTEWTVYLGTSVSPAEQLKALYNEITVNMVVSGKDANGISTGTTSYTVSRANTEDGRAVTGTQGTFKLSEIFNASSVNWESGWDTLLSTGSWDWMYYQPYGHITMEDAKVSTGTIFTADGVGRLRFTLEKEGNTDTHNTSKVGEAVETYVLKVYYEPWESAMEEEDYHTGDRVTGRKGYTSNSTNTSENTHVINVYSKPLDVIKVDKNDEPITSPKQATFELFRAWNASTDSDEDDADRKVIFGTTEGYKDYILNGMAMSGTYYRVDTQTTDAGGVAHFGNGTDVTKLFNNTQDPYILIEKTAPSGYELDVNAKTINIVNEGSSLNLYSNLEKEAISSASGAYNWNQAVKFKLTENDGTTETILDYVDKNDHSTITLYKPGMEEEEIERDSVYVFSNIENNKEMVVDPDGVFVIRYLNEVAPIDITFKKVGGDGTTGLAGAVFQLMVDKSGNGNYVKVTSDDDYKDIGGVSATLKITVGNEEKTFESAFLTTGNIQTLSQLPDGTYKLTEVYVPAGYINTLGDVIFKIEEGKMTMVTNIEEGSKISFVPASSGAIPTSDLLTITNEPGAALPNTGGPGTRLFTILGNILILGAGVLLWRRRRLI